MKVIKRSVFLIAGGVLFTGPLQAQTQEPAAAPASADAKAAGGDGEIVVTARRVSESIQRTPVSVAAVTAADLQRNSQFDIANLRPGAGVILERDPAYPNSGAFSIRGISLEDKEPTNDPAIGVAINGIFLARTYGAVVDLLDVDRVEVLRGPQGTLFGRNTIGGVVNITTHRPGDQFAVRAQASYSSFDTADLRAAVDLPISGYRAGLTLAGQYKRSDGWLKNATPGGPHVGGTETRTARGTLVLRPTDHLDLTLIGDYTRDTDQSFAAKAFELPFQVLASPSFAPFVQISSSPNTVYQNGRGPNDATYWGGSLEANYTAGDVTISSVTGYRDTKNSTFSDFDRTSSTLFHNFERIRQDQFSQELRAATKFSGSLNAVVGLYYFESGVHLRRNDTVDLCMLETLIGLPCVVLPTFFPAIQPGQVQTTDDGFYDQKDRSWAAFGQVFLDVTDRLRLTAGGRYTWERKRFTIEPADDDFGNRLQGFPDLTARAADTFKNFSPRVGIDYRFSQAIFGYASFTRGFRSGGFNGRAGSVTSIGPFDAEKVDAYEVGLKSDLLDRRLRLNVSGYVNDYSDMQLAVFRSNGFGQETIIANAGSARIKGIEVEATFKVTPRLKASTETARTWAGYRQFDADLTGSGVVTDNSRLRLRRTPKWRTTSQLDYTVPVGSGELDANIVWTYSSSFDTVLQNYDFGRRPAASEFDANLTFRPNARWRFTGFIKNAFDKRYVASGTPVGPFFSFRNYNPPRRIGVTVGVDL